MGERAYTVAEIDRMRSAVNDWLSPPDGCTYDRVRLERQVELHLRTYLEAGVSPDDLAERVRSVRPID